MTRLHFADGSTLDIDGKALSRVELLPEGSPPHVAAPPPPTPVVLPPGYSTNRDGSLRKRSFRAPTPGTQKWTVLVAFADGKQRTAFEVGLPPQIATSCCSRLVGSGHLANAGKEANDAVRGTGYRKTYWITEKGLSAIKGARAAAGEGA